MIRRVRRVAHSLIELLVVIAIIALLIGIVLPAVQRVRDAGQRSVCTNNLKQLGLGLYGFHDGNKHFPAGMTLKQGRAPEPYLSWQARILPYLEQAELWRNTKLAYQTNSNFLTAPHSVPSATVVKTFACPSDSRTSRVSHHGRALTSYLGVEGISQFERKGVLYLDSETRVADITDGTSSTLLVGERPPSHDELFGWWYAGWGQDRNGSAEMMLGIMERMTFRELAEVCRSGPYVFSQGSLRNLCSTFQFWSLHLGGSHFLFVDGSVHFLRYAAAPLLPALSSRSGGEAVALPD